MGENSLVRNFCFLDFGKLNWRECTNRKSSCPTLGLDSFENGLLLRHSLKHLEVDEEEASIRIVPVVGVD